MADYICNRCNAAFNDESAGEETLVHDEIRPIYTERFIVCPCCGSADYEDAAYCYKCNQPVRYTDLRGGYYCRDCMKEIRTPQLDKLFVNACIDEYAEWLHERRVRENANEKD